MNEETLKMPMDIQHLQEYLPHRFPFLLIDRVVSFDKEQKKLIAIKNISYSDYYLQGHFPGNPVMPGVLQIEAMGQAGTILGRLLEPSSSGVLLTSITEARFNKPVCPGDSLNLAISVEKSRKQFYWFYAEGSVNDELVSEVKFSLKLI